MSITCALTSGTEGTVDCGVGREVGSEEGAGDDAGDDVGVGVGIEVLIPTFFSSSPVD